MTHDKAAPMLGMRHHLIKQLRYPWRQLSRRGAPSQNRIVSLISYWGSYPKTWRHVEETALFFSLAAQLGWRTCLVLSRPPEDHRWLEPLKASNTMIEYLPRPRANFDLKAIERVRRLCRQVGSNVFHCYNLHTSPLIGAALAAVPVRVWSKTSMEPAYESCREPGLRDRVALSVRTSCHVATQVLTVSGAGRNELLGLGIPARKVTVFHNPRQSSQLVDRKAARANLGYNPAELVITTVGHAVPVKGWDILLRAFATVEAIVPSARLLLVGSVSRPEELDCYEELTRIVQHLRLEGRVRFVGHLLDVGSALAASDIFVLPSRSEGASNALVEALTAGLPCVTTHVGSAREIIRHGINGLIVDRDSPPQLASALLSLVHDPELRHRLAAAAPDLSALPTFDEYHERLFALYRSLLRDRGVVGA